MSQNGTLSPPADTDGIDPALSDSADGHSATGESMTGESSTSESATGDISARMSEMEKEEIAKRVIDHIQRHATAHGSFSGLADFLAQCDRIVAETRAKRGKIAVTLANSLARDVSSLREVTVGLSHEMTASVYRGITTGFLFANLRREIAEGKDRRGERFSREEYFTALAQNPKSRESLAGSLNISLQNLVKWERKYLR